MLQVEQQCELLLPEAELCIAQKLYKIFCRRHSPMSLSKAENTSLQYARDMLHTELQAIPPRQVCAMLNAYTCDAFFYDAA